MMAHSGNGSEYRRNLALAKRLWSGRINREQQHALKSLSETYGLSVAAGDLQLLESRWYVTHSGLLRLASRRRCCGIKTVLEKRLSDSVNNRWVFKARMAGEELELPLRCTWVPEKRDAGWVLVHSHKSLGVAG